VEGDHEGSAENDDHHRDDNQVRHRNLEDRLAKEFARLIQASGQ
jgi:hypothetical protein